MTVPPSSNDAVEIRVGVGSCGMASGADMVRQALEEAAHKAGAEGSVKAVGCNGMCHHEPLVEVVDKSWIHLVRRRLSGDGRQDRPKTPSTQKMVDACPLDGPQSIGRLLQE